MKKKMWLVVRNSFFVYMAEIAQDLYWLTKLFSLINIIKDAIDNCEKPVEFD